MSVDDISTFLNSPSQELPSPEPPKDASCEQQKLYEGRDQENTGVLIQYDTNCDTETNVSLFMPDETSRPFDALLDTNFDSKTDIMIEDRDRDGKWDISFLDVDFDGLTDLTGYHPDGKFRPKYYEKYAAR